MGLTLGAAIWRNKLFTTSPALTSTHPTSKLVEVRARYWSIASRLGV